MSDIGLGRPTVFIMTTDRARSVAFYSGILGLPWVTEDAHGVVFDASGTEIRLTDIAGHEPGPHPSIGFQVADIRAACEHLARADVACLIYPGFGQDAAGIWTSPDGRTHLAWFMDPDGNVLGLHQEG